MPENEIDVNLAISHDAQAIPQDIEAERSVLSAMLSSEDALQDCLVELKEEDFYLPRHRIIYNAIRYMFDNNNPVDSVSLADHLKSTKELEKVGGLAYLLDMSGDPLALTSWKHHSEILRRDTVLRHMITASAKISALAYDAPEDTKEVVDSAESMILGVTDRELRSNFVSVSDAMAQLYEQLQKQAELGEHFIGVKTRFPKLDSMLLGLRPGQMIVVGARPGCGKTSFALNLAVQAAETGASVAFFSLEMSAEEVAQRLISSRAQINLQKIRGAYLAREDWAKITQASDDLSRLDIMIDDTPGTTITEIRAKARRMLHGKENPLIIIDYLQLVSPPAGGRRDSRVTEVSEMSRGIKIMAKDLEVPVVALSQLSRQNPMRQGKRPQLSDLRESGAIEQDADIVILLDRSWTAEEAARADRPDENVTEFIIAKNRSGPMGVVKMAFLNDVTKFMELEEHAGEPGE